MNRILIVDDDVLFPQILGRLPRQMAQAVAAVFAAQGSGLPVDPPAAQPSAL